MNAILSRSAIFAILFAASLSATAQGFLDMPYRIYGKVIQIQPGTAQLLQKGELSFTFVNLDDASDAATVSTQLGAVGPNGSYSYAIDVPQQYLGSDADTLQVGAATHTYRLETITIDGVAVEALDADEALIDTRFDLRGQETRLDLRLSAPAIDTDGDGIPDWWEERHGLNPIADNGNNDTDADGISDLDEFRNSTDPNVQNLTSQILTTSTRITELGRIGLWLHAVGPNSQTGSSSSFAMTKVSLSAGFELAINGTVLANAASLTLADIHQGRAILSHTDPAVQSGVLQLQVGSTVQDIAIQVYSPSREDGTDSSIWLDAMTLTEATGNPITEWTDRSGNANNGRESQTAPTLSADVGVDFSANQAKLSFNDDFVAPGAHTVFSVYQAPAQQTIQTLLSSASLRYQLAASDPSARYPSAEVYQSGTHRLFGSSAVPTGINLSMTIADGADGFSALNRRKGSFAESAEATLGFSDTTIGAISPGFAPEPFAGKLHELLVFPAALSTARAEQVNDYLQSKWQDYVIWDYRDLTTPVTLTANDGGNAIIRGGWGNDILLGGAGKTIIRGGYGDDELTGGTGNARFVYYPEDRGHDTIMPPFNVLSRQHVIDLSALFTTPSADVDAHIQFTANQGADNSFTRIDIDLAGDGGPPDMQITVSGSFTNNNRDQFIAQGRLLTGALQPPNALSVIATMPETTEGENLPGEFRITRTGSTNSHLKVYFDLYGTAQNGVDYPFVPGMTTIPYNKSSVVVSINPYADGVVEATETVELVIRDTEAYELGSAASASLQILDQTARVSIQAVAPVAQRTGSIPGYFLVTRTGNLDQDLLVNLDITGTAVNGTDYRHVFDFVEFQPGTSNVLVPITPLGGATGAGNATVAITIAQDPAYLRASPLADLITIVDDATSVEVVTVVADPGYPSEEGPTAGGFKLKRSGAVTSLLAIDVTISGTAQNGTDYQSIPTAWAIPAGQSEVSIPIIPIADGITEQLESVTVTIEPGSYLAGGASTATTFIEDLSTSVTIEAEVATANIAGPVSGRFVLRRNKNIASTLDVALDVSGSADSGDYQAIANPISFAAGSSEAIVTITPINTGETNDVTLMLAIAASNGLPATAPSSATVTIERGGQSAGRSVVERISVTPLQSSVDPGTEEAAFLLERTGDALRELSVRVTLTGTLENGADYTYISPIAIFPAGQHSIQVTLAPISWNEGEVTVAVETVAAGNASASRSVSSTATTPAAATIAVTRNGQATYTVYRGWNLLSIPFDAPETPVTDLFGNLFTRVKEQREATGRFGYQDTTILRPMRGYWLYSKQDAEVPIDGRYLVSGSLDLGTGWHLVGPLLNRELLDHFSHVWTWDPTRQRYLRKATDKLRTTQGYLVYVPDPGPQPLGRH